MVSKKDKEHFKKLGEALNPPIQKITKKEWMQKVSFEEYIQWLSEGRHLAFAMHKGNSLGIPPADGVEQAFRRALKLGLIQNGKYTSSKSF